MLTISLSHIKHLRLEPTEVNHAWILRLPTFSMNSDAALRERGLLLSQLETAYPSRALWLSGWSGDDRLGWKLVTKESPLSAYQGDLDPGAWALFFFDGEPSLPILEQHQPQSPSNAVAALQTIAQFSAKAAIWSWYDDNEWLVAISDTSDGGS